jgi:single-strand DNA-binding protein
VLEENVDKEFKSSIAVDILGEKTNLIKQYKVGDAVKVYLNFKSNEYEGKWYNRISAWKIEGASAAASTQSSGDDLPF